MAARRTRRKPAPPGTPAVFTTYADPGIAGEPTVVTSAPPGQDYEPAALGELAGQTGFAWHCSKPVPHEPSWRGLAEVHQIDGTDRAQAEAHMRAHGLRSPAIRPKPRPWKPPPRAAWAPKPMDAGQPVKWTVYEPGRWVRPDGMPVTDPVTGGRSGTWRESRVYSRAGAIWSAGPDGPNTWWVIPDDAPEPVVVRRHGRKFSFEYREGDLHQDDGWSDWRARIARAENVRRRGLYPVVDGTYMAGGGYWGTGKRTETKRVRWHADPACPAAAGKERDDGEGAADDRHGPGWGAWTADDAVDVLTGRTSYGSSPPFCPRCVMLLEDSSEIGTSASAGNS